MPSADRYRIMGHIYDLLASLYSGWQIPRCKEAMLDRLKPEDEVLFAGWGAAAKPERPRKKAPG